MYRSLLCLAAALAPAASAKEADWDGVARYEIRLSNFSFDPAVFRLHADRPVVLRLVNDGGGGHDFNAPQFFAAATIRTEDLGLVYKGGIEVAGGQVREIALVPRRGRYKLRCTHTLHALLGMKGEIWVE